MSDNTRPWIEAEKSGLRQSANPTLIDRNSDKYVCTLPKILMITTKNKNIFIDNEVLIFFQKSDKFDHGSTVTLPLFQS